ncbi:MAG TPA: peptidylprolyl isomerase [Pyrinomonadaceae bacterium]|nr:peptidylprolyl isomerase [Pyrinomonadaceae bacterium]
MSKINQQTTSRRAHASAGRIVCCAPVLLAASLAGFATHAQQRTGVAAAPQRAQAPARGGRATVPPRREILPAVSQETLLRIMSAEDERRWDARDLGALLSDASAGVRRRAALAAGRIGDEGAVAPLAMLLTNDTSESVRAMAAFALGETESATAADALFNALRTSKSNEVRARAVEALGKVAAALPQAQAARQKELGAAILQTLAAEQKSAKPDRGVVMMALTATLRARPADASRTVLLFLSSTDARVRADAANTLARLRAKDASERLRPLLSGDADAVVRANVARALGAAEDAASFDALVARSTNDVDERVRVSAIRALGTLKDARAAVPLVGRGETLLKAYRDAKAKGAGNPSETNELLELATTLGRLLPNTNNERAVAFLRGLRDASELSAPEVETAFARVAPSLYLRARPFDNSNRAAVLNRWQSVSSVAQGLGEVAAVTNETGGNSVLNLQADAQLILRNMLADPTTPALAMPDVLRAVAAFKPLDLSEVLRARLTSADVIVRATAADLLSELPPDPLNSRALTEALPKALTEPLDDAALSILDALSKQRDPEATSAIRSALDVPDYLVRRRAAALLREMSGGASESRVETVATRNKPADYTRALARIGRRVQALVATDKGEFVLELLPEDAPLTVDNFVQLANRRYFDGITFHRVVPNFVVQGGDPRGDGNGGPGHQIRCEINMQPYTRGALGMALSGKDTGGSQWFVTHSPQPHLDGGYTVFGRVVEGLEVVDRITRGDRIRTIRIIEGKPPVRNPRRRTPNSGR